MRRFYITPTNLTLHRKAERIAASLDGQEPPPSTASPSTMEIRPLPFRPVQAGTCRSAPPRLEAQPGDTSHRRERQPSRGEASSGTQVHRKHDGLLRRTLTRDWSKEYGLASLCPRPGGPPHVRPLQVLSGWFPSCVLYRPAGAGD